MKKITITSAPALVKWFKKQIWDASPRVKMPQSLATTFNCLHDEFIFPGRLDAGLANEYIRAVLYDLMKHKPAPTVVSELVVDFIASLYGRMIEQGGGRIDLGGYTVAACATLGIDLKHLRIVKRTLTSSASFERRYNLKISVRLNDDAVAEFSYVDRTPLEAALVEVAEARVHAAS